MRRYCLILFCLFSAGLLKAQQKDFQTWWSASISAEPVKNLTFEVSPELRFENNSRSQNTFLTEVTAQYGLFKFFHFGALYRIELAKNTKGYTSEIHRYMLYGQFRLKVERFRFRYRPSYQVEYADYGNSEDGHVPLKQHRHKLSVKYPIRKSNFAPKAAIEGFFTLHPLDKVNEVKARITLGTDYEINKHMTLSLVYRYQQEYWENNPLTASIIGFNFAYTINNK